MLVACIAYLLALPTAAPQEPAPQPNVLIVYTDDQGYGDCGALNPDCRFATPNLDRLAQEGMVFRDGHSASGVCSPSRYALMTGRYAWRTRLKRGVLRADGECLIAAGRATLATKLRSAGYDTAAFGKWHMGMQIPGTKGQREWRQRVSDGPLQHGFEHFYGIPASMNFGVLTWFDDDVAIEPASLWTRKKFPASEIEHPPRDYRMAPPFDVARQRPGDLEVAPSFVDEDVLRITTEHAIEFVEQDRGGRPFFAYVALTSPHLPHCTAREFRGKSGMGNYGDFLVETDHRVGQLLDALDRAAVADNTIVLFTSDNGAENNYKDWLARYQHRSNGPWRGGKRDLYEGGHRVPFFVRWPALVAAGTTSDALIGQVDVLATICELLGLPLADNQAEDSISFASALRGGKSERTSIVHHAGDGRFGYRSGSDKLVLPAPRLGAAPELYDLEQDPGERNNLAKTTPERAGSMLEDLRRVVQAGSSRPGAEGKNDGETWWPQLTFIERPAITETYKTVGGVELRITRWLPQSHRPKDTRPAVVFFFGGGWNGGKLSQFEPQARYLASRGMVAAVADYRVKSRHRTTPFEAVADAKSAVRWLRTHAKRLGIDPERIAAGGGSAGGHLAACTGLIEGLDEPGESTKILSQANALLLFNPVFDNGPGEYGHKRLGARWREISPRHHIDADAPPTLVFFGSKDIHVPVATAKSFQAAMQQAGARCDLHIYEGQPHGFFNKFRSVEHYRLTVAAMDRFLASLGWLDGEPTIGATAEGATNGDTGSSRK
ncbi:MAG: sulfatase-like hydrolase/transferase [Planctomycetota bacterium]